MKPWKWKSDQSWLLQEAAVKTVAYFLLLQPLSEHVMTPICLSKQDLQDQQGTATGPRYLRETTPPCFRKILKL